MTPEDVAAEVDAASLLGRGGAGFPAGRKWSMLRKDPVTYLVVNGDESEPATFKDHLLVERDPHQLVEGVVIAAYALQVSQAFIYVRGEFALGLERVQGAVNDAYEHGAVGRDIFGSGFSIDVVVHPGAGAYICGDETGLLESLEGKRGFPRIKPPFFPAVIGLYGQPTVVNNVETMANLPWIITHGGAAFAALGAGPLDGHPAVRALGPCSAPRHLRGRDGENHLPRPHLRAGAGWRGPRGPGGQGHHPRRRLGPLVRARARLDLPLGQDEVGEAGSMLGSGAVTVMDRTPALSGWPGGSPSSSPASPAGSARRAGRDRAGWSGYSTASSTGEDARRTSTSCST